MREGDKVRVQMDVEGVVDEDGNVKVPDGIVLAKRVLDRDDVEVTALQESFRPGDVLQSKADPRYFFLLGEGFYRSFTPFGSNIWPYGMTTNTIAEAFPVEKFTRIKGLEEVASDDR